VVRPLTDLPVVLAEDFPQLRAAYAEMDAKVGLYVNNSMRNFQSLLETRMLHVHINHGESDKQSMASNNAKSYDRLFVAGEAAVQRVMAGLLEFDTTKLVRIGRPQLDLRLEPVLAPSRRRTVMYAPTWEGDADYNNYSSLDRFGPQLVRRLLDVPDVRVVYKPHPRTLDSDDRQVRVAHAEIAALLDGEHVVLEDADILAVMPDCDAMVTDVSSVGLDWLYLRTEAPLLITDRHGDADRFRQEVPVSRCADVVDESTVADLADLLAARLDHDEHHLARLAMRHFYFDDIAVGDSTTRFLDAVDELVSLRDRLLASRLHGDAITA
jgi:hypothetical protein